MPLRYRPGPPAAAGHYERVVLALHEHVGPPAAAAAAGRRARGGAADQHAQRLPLAQVEQAAQDCAPPAAPAQVWPQPSGAFRP
jgi:hypothetical protein